MLSINKATLIALLAVGLSGCATAGRPEAPPAELYSTCEKPVLGGKTNGDMANYVIALKSALAGCTALTEAWTEWATGTFGKPPAQP